MYWFQQSFIIQLVLAVIHYPINVPQGKVVGKEETDTIFW